MRKLFSILSIITIFSLFPFFAFAVCSEPNASQYLVCEDWDTDTPPNVNWPCTRGNLNSHCNPNTPGTCCYPWHGWSCTDSAASDDEKSQVTTERAHSGTKSLRETSQLVLGTERAGTDIYHSISGHPTSVYIRFYVYVENFDNITAGHFIFLNSASGAEASIDWRDCTDQGYRTCSGMYMAPHSYGPEVWQANNNQPSAFNWLNHTNEWVLVEVKFDFGNHQAEMWINGIEYLHNWSVNFDWSTIEDIIISGWRSLGTSNDQSYWIDDVVVSTSYIGPRNDSQPLPDTTPPSPPSGVMVS